MSKGIILYQSKYGATKKYAQWLQEETGFDWLETKSANWQQPCEYDTIILTRCVQCGTAHNKKHISEILPG